MKIYSIDNIPKKKIIEFFKHHWGSSKIVITSGVYDCTDLDGLTVINEDGEIIGLITYTIKNNELEIISLNSIEEGKGIGTSLIKKAENIAIRNKCKLIKLITTNDNVLALKFYQKRGFILSQIFNNAVEKARVIKPEIPLIGNYGIPIRDEIELIKVLN